jgi:Ser/Thr protein kinase RdoA (MazF antagonist)
VKVHRGAIHLLDFDDSRWGYPIQDIGIALFHAMFYPNRAELWAAFEDGYTGVRSWPEGDLATFIAARDLDDISFSTHTPSVYFSSMLPRMLERAEKRLTDWLRNQG